MTAGIVEEREAAMAAAARVAAAAAAAERVAAVLGKLRLCQRRRWGLLARSRLCQPEHRHRQLWCRMTRSLCHN